MSENGENVDQCLSRFVHNQNKYSAHCHRTKKPANVHTEFEFNDFIHRFTLQQQ